MRIEVQPSESILTLTQSFGLIVLMAVVIASIFVAADRIVSRYKLAGTVQVIPIAVGAALAILAVGIACMAMMTKDANDGDWTDLEAAIAVHAPMKTVPGYLKLAKQLEHEKFYESSKYKFVIMRNSSELFTVTKLEAE